MGFPSADDGKLHSSPPLWLVGIAILAFLYGIVSSAAIFSYMNGSWAQTHTISRS
jgi:hypothetical protein